DERDDRDQVEQVRGVPAQLPAPVPAEPPTPLLGCSVEPAPPSSRFGGSRFLNISSIRSVTTKPPTTFAEASTTARKPITQVKVSLWSTPSTIIAPTMTMPWIAF